MTEWRIVPDHPDYEISEYGKVRRICPIPPHLAGREVSPWLDKDGYLKVKLRNCGKRGNFMVHRLVAMAFISEAPGPAYEAAHNDGSKQNNHFMNLRWATRTENENDKFKHGTHNRGERHGRASISEQHAMEILQAAKTSNLTLVAIAAQFGVHRCMVFDIVHKRSWKHLEAA